MTDRIFDTFLRRQYDEGLALAADSDLVRVLPIGDPADRFVVALGCKGLVQDPLHQIHEAEHFEVSYGLRTVGAGTRLASWSVRVTTEQAVPSLVGLYAGADWQEREQLDLVGVAFAGHPDPRRLMMPQSWDGHPLRRDYPADQASPPWR